MIGGGGEYGEVMYGDGEVMYGDEDCEGCWWGL